MVKGMNTKFVKIMRFAAMIFIAFIAGCKDNGNSKEQKTMYKNLTAQEERVIIHKETEPPFSGAYYNNHRKGLYLCKQCGKALFESSSKFESECGWPSFDDQIAGAVIKQKDADGIRTEIICGNCGGHLGHIFSGENFTPKNTRYCVNSISMDFIENGQRGIFAAGCFWGVEYYFKSAPGVISTTVGYIGGHTEKPTYEQVCTDKTGYAEAIEVVFDPAKTSYEDLAKLFFEIHDFTQLDRQGPDIGTQYRSGIYYLNKQQKETAEKLITELTQKGYDVKTELKPAQTFWPAEQYHQRYYEKNGKTPYCHIRKKIF
ncbi:MAG: bifunctional methionine sulfoxide reductase B/A protein [Phycisphaerae bacterium]